jgi:hypothetical protein
MIFLFSVLCGLSYGMVLFLLAAGLSIVFGLMGIVNLAHGRGSLRNRRKTLQSNSVVLELVPEVGIPSTHSGQAPRHGIEAPRDFEF